MAPSRETPVDLHSVSAPLAISNREEDELRKKVRLDALKQCDPIVKEFADCATGRTVSVVWACRQQHNAVKECMRQHMGEEAMKEHRRQFLQDKRNQQGASSVGLAKEAKQV